MTPTIALKSRLEHVKKQRNPTSRPTSGLRTVSIGSEADVPARFFHRVSSENEAANLLLSMSGIVSDEMKSNACLFEDETKTTSLHRTFDGNEVFLTPHAASDANAGNDLFVWNRVRTVSMDSSGAQANSRTLAVVSPTTTPVKRGGRSLRKTSRRLSQKTKKESRSLPKMPQLYQNADVRGQKKKGLQGCDTTGRTLKKILRKKFSWKNYPELETFLIANREEYLRHSALNYTVQQKQYNNRLTERLLELAAEHGYIFDETEFSFVTVRDRIRCYFKSYVQSAKKRGVVIGYAARKAGLLSDEELERSAERKGRIYTPNLP
eukprot:scaffold2381_cov128-Cylindrotheca_fusiformis.AAC.11